MASQVVISAECEGGSLSALADLVSQRADALRETTRDAVVATAINVLSSLRARTKVADPKKDSGLVSVGVASGLCAGWRRDGAHRCRCIRHGVGGAVADLKFVNLSGHYSRGETPLVFLAQDRVSSAAGRRAARYYIIAPSESVARTYAVTRHRRRVERFAGMAKWALGTAMARTSTRTAADMRISKMAESVANRNIHVEKLVDGFGSGSFGYAFQDTLNYATLALKGGASDLDLAVRKAANRTAGIINNHFKKFGVSNRVEPPFPEITGRR